MPVDVQSIFYNQPLAPILCIAVALVIVLSISCVIADRAFIRHSVTG